MLENLTCDPRGSIDKRGRQDTRGMGAVVIVPIWNRNNQGRHMPLGRNLIVAKRFSVETLTQLIKQCSYCMHREIEGITGTLETINLPFCLEPRSRCGSRVLLIIFRIHPCQPGVGRKTVTTGGLRDERSELTAYCNIPNPGLSWREAPPAPDPDPSIQAGAAEWLYFRRDQ